MEKVSKNTKKKPNPILGFFKDYVSDFGFRQIATLVMIASTIILLIGIIIPHDATVLTGFYGFALASLIGIIGCILNMVKAHRRSPTFKRALFNLIVLIVLLGIAITGIVVVSINGIYVA